MKRVTRNGATVEMAIASALDALGVTREEVEIEVLFEGKKGFLGFGAKDAEVTVTIKEVEQSFNEKALEEEVQNTKSNEVSVVELAQEVQVVEDVQEEQVEKTAKQDPLLSDEEAKDATITYLQEVANAMGIEDIEVHYKEEGKYITFQLESEKAAYLIGKRGQTLNALQQLAQLVMNKYSKQFKVIRIDVGNYRERREKALEQLADRMADKAIRSGRKVELEPMPSYERKVIHNALSHRLDIETYSEGTEPNRYLVIEAIR